MPDFPDDADGAVLASLAAQGVDLSQPRLIEFAVDAPGDAAAEQISQAMKQAGYESEIDYDAGEPDEEGYIDPDDEEFGPVWTVLAKVTMVPEYDEIIRIQDDLNRLATPFGGECDGWGTLL